MANSEGYVSCKARLFSCISQLLSCYWVAAEMVLVCCNFIGGCHYVFRLSTCSVATYPLSTQCLLTVCSLSTHCLLTVYSLSTHCPLTVHSLSTRCLLAVYSLSTHCLLTVHSHCHCFQLPLSQLGPNRLLFTPLATHPRFTICIWRCHLCKMRHIQ